MMKRLLDPLKNWFYDMPLSRKMFSTFFVVTILPLSIFAWLLYSTAYATEQKKAEDAVRQAFDQTASYLEFKVRHLNSMVNLTAGNELVQSYLKKYRTMDMDNTGEHFLGLKKLNEFLSGVKGMDEIYEIRFYYRNLNGFIDTNSNFLNLKDAEVRYWFQKLSKNGGRVLWCPQDYFGYEERTAGARYPAETISIVKSIANMEDYKDPIGIVRFDIRGDDIRKILTNGKAGNKAYGFLINGEGVLISSSEERDTPAPMNLSLPDVLQAIGSGGKTTWKTMEMSGVHFLAGVKPIPGTDWKLLAILPYTEILASYQSLRVRLVLLVIAVLLSAYVIAFIISRTNASRLKKFVQTMDRVERGDFSIAALPKNRDEIGELARKFNSMLTKIAILMDEKYELGYRVKNAELKALQAQINPHFLYNTLDLVNWFSRMGMDKQLQEVVLSLTKFYRLTLSRGEDLIPLEDELSHVAAYVDIQNQRFKGSIGFSVNMDEKVRRVKIPKITLQPIVENSIMHGIREKREMRGNIEITASMEGSDLLIVVADDGVGMDGEKLEKLEMGLCESSGSSYGIKNIRERLAVYYGEKYGLSFQSVPGMGTKATVRIPAEG